MTILRVGTNAKYANGWDDAFGKGKSAKAGGAKKAAKKAPAKKAKKKR
jgi:hypothetical protein